MSNLFEVTIPLHFSKKAAWIFAGIYATAFSAVFFSEIPMTVKIILSIAIIADEIRVFRRYICLSHPKSLIQIRYQSTKWILKNKKGNTWEVPALQLIPLPCRILLLRFEKTKTACLFDDGTTPEYFHQMLLFARLL